MKRGLRGSLTAGPVYCRPFGPDHSLNQPSDIFFRPDGTDFGFPESLGAPGAHEETASRSLTAALSLGAIRGWLVYAASAVTDLRIYLHVFLTFSTVLPIVKPPKCAAARSQTS